MSQKQNKIFEPLVIVSNALAGGGAEKTMLALHQEFIAKGIDCHLIALNQSIEVDNMKNIKVLNRFWGDKFKSTINNFLNFRRLLKEINPKSIIVNCELPELYISLLKTHNCRVICVEHTSIPWHERKGIGIIVRLLLKAKQVEWVTVVKGQNRVWFTRNAQYIPNPYIGPTKILKNSFSKTSLVFIGGLKKNKRPMWVIESGIKSAIPVNVYGEGNLRASLESKFSNCRQNISFHGFKANAWELIPENSLVVIPSKHEGDGMVVIEAIILKFPIALAKNKDLLRFGLENKHYFNSLNDLIDLINQNKSKNFLNLIADEDFRRNLIKERSLDLVVANWIFLLNK
jgi:hypothetical protein